MVIRKMQLEDIRTVCNIENQSFSDPWSADSFQFSIKSDSDYCIVAFDEQDNKVIGFALLRCSFDVADLINIAVDEEYRRQGIGSLLLNNLIEYGEKKEIVKCFLEVRESNKPAIGLYKKMGFLTEGIRYDYYTDPTENAFVMCRREVF